MEIVKIFLQFVETCNKIRFVTKKNLLCKFDTFDDIDKIDSKRGSYLQFKEMNANKRFSCDIDKLRINLQNNVLFGSKREILTKLV